MVLFPSQLSKEEKNLKKNYLRLQEKRRQLQRKQEKPSTANTARKQVQKELVNPKDAREAAKKLLETGKLVIQKSTGKKRSGFKRVGEVADKALPPSKKPNHGHSNLSKPQGPPPKELIREKVSEVKELYSRFVKAADVNDLTGQRIPRKKEQPVSPPAAKASVKQCTVFVECKGMDEEALRNAFSRFGEMQLDVSRGSVFITYESPDVAATARKEMNGGMIRGVDVLVQPAGEENGYVELPPEAASQPWAQIAAGRQITDSPVSKRERLRGLKTYEADF